MDALLEIYSLEAMQYALAQLIGFEREQNPYSYKPYLNTRSRSKLWLNQVGSFLRRSIQS